MFYGRVVLKIEKALLNSFLIELVTNLNNIAAYSEIQSTDWECRSRRSYITLAASSLGIYLQFDESEFSAAI